MRVARYYRTARTTHLERLREFTSGDFFYQREMYDFDTSGLTPDISVQRVTFSRVLRMVWSAEYDLLEIVEPYAPSALPQSVMICLTARLSRLLRRRSTALVTYAIENADLPSKFASQFSLPPRLTTVLLRILVGFSYRSLSRVAFGTEDSQANYRNLLGRKSMAPGGRPETILLEGLPAPRPGAIDQSSPPTPVLVFVGAFDDRKGILRVLDAWPNVRERLTDARLVVMGKGPLEAEVLQRIRSLEAAAITVDPSRPEIWRALSAASALVLLSQPGTGWKEQIGLPIVEGLSVGLEIVSSNETGLASWLQRHGHRVLDPSISTPDFARALVDVLATARTRGEVLAGLPRREGRLLADEWLLGRPLEEPE